MTLHTKKGKKVTFFIFLLFLGTLSTNLSLIVKFLLAAPCPKVLIPSLLHVESSGAFISSFTSDYLWFSTIPQGIQARPAYLESCL